MNSTNRFRTLAILAFMLSFPTAAWPQSYSHARVVRLSFAQGSVTLERPDTDEWTKALVNTPIQEGFKLATADNSFAEVEFENGSTARLGENSLLDFTQLALAPDGGKLNQIALDHGYATFSMWLERGDSYQIQTSFATVTPGGKSVFRIDLDQGAERVEVFKGSVSVSSQFGSGELSKNHVLNITPSDQEPYQVTKGIVKDAWDNWVSERQQVNQEAGNNYGMSAPYNALYGWNDLSYYGNWNYLPGYGYGWIPTGVPYGWMPYSFGQWCWYPGFGYTWISYEPWGWLPFHYGNWFFDSDFGWVWIPAGFDYWSPALVTWYQGPGWVGWVPTGTTFNTTRRFPIRGCPAGQNCAITMTTQSFQNGKPVSPKTISILNIEGGRVVADPALPITRRVRLPGPVAAPPQFVAKTEAASYGTPSHGVRRTLPSPVRTVVIGNHPAGAPEAGKSGTFPGGGSTESRPGIVFDSSSHRFVNSAGGVSATEPKSEPSESPDHLISNPKPSPSPETFKEPAPAAGEGVHPQEPRSFPHRGFWGGHRASSPTSRPAPSPNFGGRTGGQARTGSGGSRNFSSHPQPSSGSFGGGMRSGGFGGATPSHESAPAPRASGRPRN